MQTRSLLKIIFIGILLCPTFGYAMALEESPFVLRWYHIEMDRIDINESYTENPTIFELWKVGHILESLIQFRKVSGGVEIDNQISEAAREYISLEDAFYDSEGTIVPKNFNKLWSMDFRRELISMNLMLLRNTCADLF